MPSNTKERKQKFSPRLEVVTSEIRESIYLKIWNVALLWTSEHWYFKLYDWSVTRLNGSQTS